MPFHKILVATDFSEQAGVAIARAAFLARSVDAELHVVHVMPLHHHAKIYSPATSRFDVEFEDSSARTKAIVSELGVSGVRASGQSVQGAPAETIGRVAKEWVPDLMVVGSHGHGGWRQFVVGNVAGRVLRAAECPVLVVRGSLDEAASPIQRIALATDFSPHAENAKRLAISLCRALNARLDLLHTIDLMRPGYIEVPPSAETIERWRVHAAASLAEAAREVRDAGISGAEVVLEGDPALEMARYLESEGVDLMVLGTRGLTGLRHFFLGSVAECILHRVPCSVLTVHDHDPTGTRVPQ